MDNELAGTNHFEENEPKRLNNFQRIIGIIFSPQETMRDIIARPKVLFPLIMIAVITALLLLMNFGIYKDYLRVTTGNTYEKMEIKMTSEQLDSAVNKGSFMGLFTTPAVMIIILLLGTLILFGLIKIFGGQGSFKQFLSITGYSYIILIFSQVLTAVLSLVEGVYKTVPVTSLQSVLPGSLKEGFLYGALSSIELFTLWNYFVVSIGVVMVSRLSKAKVYTAIGIILLCSFLEGGIGGILGGLFK